jgi:hypothetical protein
MILTVPRRKEFDEFDGMNPKPTTYRSAEILPNCKQDNDRIPVDQELVEIRQLVRHDRLFCQRLRNDKTFHDIFWYWKHRDGGN